MFERTIENLQSITAKGQRCLTFISVNLPTLVTDEKTAIEILIDDYNSISSSIVFVTAIQSSVLRD